MTYLIVLKLYIVTEHEMILSDFYEVCQLQNGLNPLGPHKLMLLLWSRCFTNPSKSWFFNDLGPLGTPLKLKLHPNYVVLESTRVIITICFLIVLVTQFQMLVSCVVLFSNIQDYIDQVYMLENISEECFKADLII